MIWIRTGFATWCLSLIHISIMDRIPAKRLGKPEDLVGALIYLSSHASDYMNGAVMIVDGGWMGR